MHAALKTALGLALLQAGHAHAQSPKPALYPTLIVTSDYRYDGASNSSGNPAVQASLYLWRPDHIYAGIFLTSVDFSGYYDPDTSYEVDIYAGYNWDFGKPYFEMSGDATRVSVQAMYTLFPDQGPPGPTYDFLQLKGELQHRTGRLTLRAETAYVPQSSYGAGFAWKYEGGAKYALTQWLSLSGEYGYRENQRKPDRSWWDIGAIASWGQFDLDLRYYDTDLDYVECGFSPNCSSAVVASLSWNPWKG